MGTKSNLGTDWIDCERSYTPFSSLCSLKERRQWNFEIKRGCDSVSGGKNLKAVWGLDWRFEGLERERDTI